MRRTAFISHASQDADAARQICEYLEREGVPCWIAPRDVTPGREYGAEIIEGLLECPVLVLVLSENANKSIYVKREIERGVSAGKPVFPIRIREVTPSRSLELFVASSHWIDAWQPPLHQHLDRLIRSIKSAVSAVDGTSEGLGVGDRTMTVAMRRPSPFRTGRKPIAVLSALIGLGLVVAGAGWWLIGAGELQPPRPQETAPEASAPERPNTQDAVDGASAKAEKIQTERPAAPGTPESQTTKGGDHSEEVKKLLTLLNGRSGNERYRSITNLSNFVPAHLTVPEALAIIGDSANRTTLLSSYIARFPPVISLEDAHAILEPTSGADRYRTLGIIQKHLPKTLTAEQLLGIIGDSANRRTALEMFANRLSSPLSFEETRAILASTSGVERYRAILAIKNTLPENLSTEQALTIIGDSHGRLDLLSLLIKRLPQRLSMDDAMALIGTSSGVERYRTIIAIEKSLPQSLSTKQALTIIGDSHGRLDLLSLLIKRLPQRLSMDDAMALIGTSSGVERYRTIIAIEKSLPQSLSTEQALTIIGDSHGRLDLLSLLIKRLPQRLSMDDAMALIGTSSGVERYRTIIAIEKSLPQSLSTKQALTIIGDSHGRLDLLSLLIKRLPQRLSMDDAMALIGTSSGVERYRTIIAIEKSLPQSLSTKQALMIIGDSHARLDLLSLLIKRLPQRLSMGEALALIGTSSGVERYRTIQVIASRLPPGLTAEETLEIVGDSSNRDQAINLVQQQAAR
ncbi:MAG: toll/interleukin-1 receptor domain-containing protein [Rhodospirillales bacterium]|nr:toll/interleukin-1 receptor domain-containing protein [Rhodospirillales bacterium]